MTLGQYVQRQRRWSKRTFGEDRRTKGILEHIKKELAEIENDPQDLEEWIDVIILALDGYWRHGGAPFKVMEYMVSKQNVNFGRQWPPIQPEDLATEHIRLAESSTESRPPVAHETKDLFEENPVA